MKWAWEISGYKKGSIENAYIYSTKIFSMAFYGLISYSVLLSGFSSREPTAAFIGT